jgi:hypothetical protein
VVVSFGGFSSEHRDVADGDSLGWHNVGGFHSIEETSAGTTAWVLCIGAKTGMART